MANLGPKKRSRDVLESSGTPATKRQATGSVAPIFTPNIHRIKWSEDLGPTCLLGDHLEFTLSDNQPAAMFDVDGTLIKPKSGNKFALDFEDWTWLYSHVIPTKLKELHSEGFAIFFLSNQLPSKRSSLIDYFKEWQKKLDLVARALPSVPFRVLAAKERDIFRKPMPGMWNAVENMFDSQGLHVDISRSYFVGNAAGRLKDHDSTDRKFALNIGVAFHTPEEFFLGEKPSAFTLKGFHPSSIPEDRPRFLPSSSPILPKSNGKPNIVLFVGPPAIGKTRFYQTYFEPAGYIHINQDTLKSKSNCLNAVEDAVSSGKSVVVDNTNRNVKTRQDYFDVAKQLGAAISCVWFDESNVELPWHNNIYRALCLPQSVKDKEAPRKLLDIYAFNSFRVEFEPPTSEEGFFEIKRVFWHFQGSEEERKRYMMWLQV